MQRNRIKIKMSSRNKSDFKTKDFHFNQIPLSTPKRTIRKFRSVDDPEAYHNMTLPILALNDVFIGERAASMVTNLEISYQLPEEMRQKYLINQQCLNQAFDQDHESIEGLDQEDKTNFNDGWIDHHSQKNSGLIICTGTGSTGWSKSSNYISADTMRTVLEKIKNVCKCDDLSKELESELGIDINKLSILDSTKFANLINETRTTFNPENPILGVTFREPINSKISVANDSNFIQVNKLRAKSKLTYGMISIDGTTYYDFSRGAIVEVLTDPSFAINCITTEGVDPRDYYRDSTL